MPKCKVCGYRLNDGAAKCPMCGAEAGSTVAGEISENADLPQYKCPSCGEPIVGEHRFCPNCGVNIKEAAQKAAEKAKAEASEPQPTERKCAQCGAVLPPSVKFCPACGAKVEEEENVRQKSAQNQNEKVQNAAASESAQVKKMGFFEAIGSCFKHYADFKGRARRKEFWSFTIFALAAFLLLWYGLGGI